MSRIKKVVGFVFAFLVISVLGITKINADDFLTVSADTSKPEGWWINPQISLIKYGQDGNYVFCLDSEVNVDLNVPLKVDSSLYADKLDAVNKIITKAIELGLNSDKNQFGISKSDFYGVTQIAIWKAIHGEETYGYTNTFKNWILKNSYEDYLEMIYSGVNEKAKTYNVKLEGSDKLSESGNYMVSGDIKVKSIGLSNDVVLTLSIDGGEVFYNGSWTKGNITVKNGDIIKVRTEKNSSVKKYDILLSVKSEKFVNGYVTTFYRTKTDGFQNVGAFKPKYANVSTIMNLTGEFFEVKPLKVSKTDATGQKELTGAKLTLKDSNGKIVTSWVSDENKIHYVNDLEIGAIYEIVEDYAPEGFRPLKNSIKFILNNDGSVTTCNIKKDSKGNDECEAMSTEDILKIKNEVSKGNVVISKKDFTNGDELSGAHLQVLDVNGNVVVEWTSTDEPYKFSLSPGKYVLVETLPSTNYNPEMIILGNRTSRYEFEVVDEKTTKIDVYNEIIEVPITGMDMTSLYIIGGLITLLGSSIVVVAKKKEII